MRAIGDLEGLDPPPWLPCPVWDCHLGLLPAPTQPPKALSLPLSRLRYVQEADLPEEATKFGWHAMGCKKGKWRTRRHDLLVHHFADKIAELAGGVAVYTTRQLGSSANSGTVVDACIQFPDGRRDIKIDPVCVVIYTSGNYPTARDSPASMFTHIAAKKYHRHRELLREGSEMRCDFYPIVITTAGAIGPSETVEWLEELWSRAIKQAALRGECPHRLCFVKTNWYRTIAAIAARGTTKLIKYLNPVTTQRTANVQAAVRSDGDDDSEAGGDH